MHALRPYPPPLLIFTLGIAKLDISNLQDVPYANR